MPGDKGKGKQVFNLLRLITLEHSTFLMPDSQEKEMLKKNLKTDYGKGCEVKNRTFLPE